MTSTEVDVGRKQVPVRRTSVHRLRTIRFPMNGREYQAIEQNPEKPSLWGQLAREGHQVVQFKDIEKGKFVAVAINGQIKVYGAYRSGEK